ncbi:MAG: carboxypeptidase-like regulatory domain-containing protein, partial [Acidobacteriota bacterium]|nr:carboxypeptidase-like regulatory domain-containing protein [Acidobacteriota bacterium]
MALPKTRTQIRILFCSAACLCLFFFLASPPPAEAGAETLVWGRVLDAGGRPIPGAVVSVSGEDLEEEASVSADAAGWYALVGLRPGAYAIRAAAPLHAAVVRPRVVCEPDGRVFAAFTLEKTGAGTGSAAVREDLFPNGRVFIPAVQIESLPTGRSVDSLIENQASTATADRIDVGGMWEAVPSLFGSRGAASWTQNVFLWNGQDVTEPFEGGTPLVVPDLFALESFFLTDSAVPIQALTPGSTVDLTPFRGTSSFHGAVQGFYLDKSFASSNITPALREEGLTESDTFNRLMDVSLRLSGPLFGGRWTYFTSWAVDTAARDLADYEPLDESSLVSGLVHLVRDGDRRRLRLFWTGQAASHSSAGAAGGVPPET